MPTKEIFKNEQHNLKSETSTNVKNSIDVNTKGLLKLMDQLDPMLSWETLGWKFLSKYSLFEDSLERARLKSFENSPESIKNDEPLKVFHALLIQVDELLENIKCMLENCCDLKSYDQNSSQQDLPLSAAQSSSKFLKSD